MPIHAWSKTDAGLVHRFHQPWIITRCDGLDAGGPPPDYCALSEVVAGEVHLATARPPARLVPQAELDPYAPRAVRTAIRPRLGEVVAVVEIVAPGNKGSRAAIRSFVARAVEYLRRGVHLLVIDLFPPTSRDPLRAAFRKRQKA